MAEAVKKSGGLRGVRAGSCAAAVLGLLLLAACLCASWGGEPPRFELARAGHSIRPVDYPLLQSLGDWIRGRKYLVLTFDDGPYGSGIDEQILDSLRRHHARAIFFVVCRNLDRADPTLYRRERSGGDLIGNHSYSHAHLNHLSDRALRREIEGCSDLISHRVGLRPVFFRPPFGQTSEAVGAVERSSGLQEMLWDANSEDSWQTRPDQILRWSEREVDNFSILLMHSKPTTASALDSVLDSLERRGYQFVLPSVPPPSPNRESK